jgi:co-chaperonin GroES (HSP10)|tara:strand:- start:193 stop:609 length:417 start_codon:yes stop_codon:yes gene_type:complete
MQQPSMGNATKNDVWITEVHAKDPDVLPSIPGFHILVRPISVKEKTKGGLYLPDSVKNDISYLTTVGKVLSVGDSAYLDEVKFPKGAWCKEGDYVCYGKHSGQKFFYKGIKLILLYDDQISMVVENPKDLDPTYNLTN